MFSTLFKFTAIKFLSSAVLVLVQKEQLEISVHQDVAVLMVGLLQGELTRGFGFVLLFLNDPTWKNAWSTLWKQNKEMKRHISLMPRQEFWKRCGMNYTLFNRFKNIIQWRSDISPFFFIKGSCKTEGVENLIDGVKFLKKTFLKVKRF